MMGLDMYLMKRQNGTNDCEVEIGYWRKVNSIHNWFVQNVQDGIDERQESLVSKEDLERLLEVCQKVSDIAVLEDGNVLLGTFSQNTSESIMLNILNTNKDEIVFLKTQRGIDAYKKGKVIKNEEEISALLPTTGGFFFGSTAYDEYYINDIKDTINILKTALKETNFDKEEIYYQASW